MAFPLRSNPWRRRGDRLSNFQRAAEGSMSLMEHLIELRSRLMKACLGIVAGAIACFFLAGRVQHFLTQPYCDFMLTHDPRGVCSFNMTGPLDQFMLTLKIALYLGLVVAAPIWLYQLWAFIAPGLHRRERRFTYTFAAVAAPLFGLGVFVGYLVVSRSMRWLLGLGMSGVTLTVNLDGYFDFVTNVMLLFGAAFEFPLVVAMLNIAGLVSAKRLLGWWRPSIFLMFLFAAMVTPTPDPFGMTILAGCMAVLYFLAVGVAFLNDRRRARRALYQDLDDDEASPLDDASLADPVEPVSPMDAPQHRPTE